MKKLFFTLLLAGTTFAAQAQKNTLLVYGTLGVQTTKTADDYKTNNFEINPGIGYQFTDHWTAGVNLSAKSWKNGIPAVKSNSFGAGPFVRYAHPLSDIFAVYGQFNANYLTSKWGDVKANGFQGEIFPAIGVNLKNGFALNFNFGRLGIITNKIKGASSSSTDFGITFGSGGGFGISKNFGL